MDKSRSIFQKIVSLLKGDTPARMIFVYYFYIILFGGILLSLPIFSNDGSSLSLLDGIFTATSATSVTGLIVVTTSEHFNFFGQLIILILIHLGGLGVMVIKSAVYRILKKKIGIKDRELIMKEQNRMSFGGMVKLTKNILKVVLTFEAIGATILTFRFITKYDMPFFKALWNGIFHSASAINNAGFDITGNSLLPFVNDYPIQLTFIMLIIIGGIGFPVILDIVEYFASIREERRFKFSLFTKLTVSTYFIILVIGFVLILAFEWEYFLNESSYSFMDKIFIALFQSVTTRNAGFATVDLAGFRQETLSLMSLMMFIGASPSSTGGGVRTTTFAIVMIFVYRMALGYKDINIFKRRLPKSTITNALVTVILGIIINFVAIMIMLVSERMDIVDIFFEVASAFGTTGLSVGITNKLSVIGRSVIIIVMFIGQIGITTTILIWATRSTPSVHVKYPEENVSIG